MPNKTNTSRARVSKNTSKGGFKFRWWMAAGLVIVVALVGVLVLRYSKAAGGTIAQMGGRECSRVTLTHQYAKTSVASNVCLAQAGLTKDGSPNGATHYYSARVGRPATYCVWGRYSAKPGEEIKINFSVLNADSGEYTAGPTERYNGSNSGVTGYSPNFYVSGDNIKLACVYATFPNVDRFSVTGSLSNSTDGAYGKFLVFLDQITVEY